MRILRVIASMDPASGGPCQGIRNSVPALVELGHPNEVVCLNSKESDFLGTDPFPVHAMGPARGPWAYSPALLPWLTANLHRFDVVIVHGLWLYHGYAVLKALGHLRKSQKKLPRLFVMPHGMLDPYFQRDPSRRLKAIRNWLYWKAVEQRLIHAADGLLFTCEEELKLAREAFRPYHPKKEWNVGYGISEPPAFNPSMRDAILTACPHLGDRPYLLFLSRIHPKKGVDLLIHAYAKLARARLSVQCSDFSVPKPPFPDLVIAGPLDSDYAREMQALANQVLPPQPSICPPPTAHRPPPTANGPPPTANGPPPTANGPPPTAYRPPPTAYRPPPTAHRPPPTPLIHFPGMLQGDAKWGAFYGCDAFVLPSHQENFGIAVVEALACGKHVLISNKVNIWREIEADHAGLVADDTEGGTKDLLKRYFDSQHTVHAPRNCFEKHYSIDEAARRMASALEA